MPKLPDATSFGQQPSLRAGRFGAPPGGNVAIAQSQQDLGGSIAYLGQAIGSAVKKQKDHDDKTMVEGAYNTLRENQLDLTSGDDGFVHKKGINAKDIYKNYNDRFNNKVDEISGKLENDEQRGMFKKRADISSLQFKQDSLNHATAEKDAYAKEVYGSTLTLEQNEAASRWNDKNAISLSLGRINSAISEEADRNGWSAKKEKATKLIEASKVHAGVIKQALASGDNEYARQWYKKNKNVFDADARASIEKVISMGERKELAQTVTDDIIAKDMSETDALKMVRKKYKGKEESEIVSLLKTRFNEQEQAHEAGQRRAGDEAWQAYEDSGSYDAIPVTVINEMDGKEALALKKYAEKEAAGATVTTDLETYEDLLIEAETNPSQFAKRNILSYSDKLSETDRRFFIKAKASILKGEAAPDIAVARTRQQIINTGVTSLGGDPKKPYSEDSEKAYKRMDNEILSFQAQTGKPPSKKDMQDIVDRVSIETLRKRRFIWPEKETAGITEVEGVPTNLVDEYALKVQRQGKPVTHENIRGLYLYWQKKQQGITPKAPQVRAPERQQEFLETPVPQAD